MTRELLPGDDLMRDALKAVPESEDGRRLRSTLMNSPLRDVTGRSLGHIEGLNREFQRETKRRETEAAILDARFAELRKHA